LEAGGDHVVDPVPEALRSAIPIAEERVALCGDLSLLLVVESELILGNSSNREAQ
jgi:hypothetical protein